MKSARVCLGVLLALSVGACSFDTSGLTSRPPCAEDSDCELGSVCVAGSCWSGPTDLDDLGDAGPDGGDGGPDADATELCTPNQSVCVGDTLETCSPDGSEVVRTDCGSDDVCPAGGCVCGAGACQTTSCVPGIRRCDGGFVEECLPDGSGYTQVEECDGAEVCAGGACTEADCAPGDEYCVGDTLVRCTPEGSPSVFAECATSSAWCSDEPTPHCEPWSCTPLTQRCIDARNYQACDGRGVGYGPATACAGDTFCAEGECVPLDCTPGSQTCVGPTVYATCRADGATPDIEECEAGRYCADLGDGAITCRVQACTPGARQCGDNTTLEICDDRGAGYTIAINCESAEYCNAGVCEAQVCVPGGARCVGDFAYNQCDLLGATEALVTCGAGTYCAGSAGSAGCEPQVCVSGSRQCLSMTVVEECDPRGAGFLEAERCGASSVCESGVCAPVVCEPTELTCADGRSLSRCNALGTGSTSEACEAGTYCDGGACIPQVCAPDTRTCVEDGVEVCDEVGSGVRLAETCEFGCSAGACLADTCGNGIVGPGEACDDANAIACDGCEGCRVLRAGTIAASTLTSSVVAWPPVSADFTFEAWVLPQANDGAWFGIGPRTGTDFVWAGVAAGRPRFEVAMGAGDVLRLDGPSSVRDGDWHHIAFQRSAIWGLAIWVDGELVNFSHTQTGNRSVDGSGVIWVGSDGSTTPAAALIDEVRLSITRRYSRRFSPARSLGTDGQTLAYYRLDEASGTAVTDDSGNGRSLAVSGLPRVADQCLLAEASAVRCGDGRAASWEECDDGNAAAGDGCFQCVREICGAWVRGFGDRCYSFEVSREWTDQRGACRSAGGDLVTIEDERENDWIVYMFDLPSTAWIGLNDRGREGTYEWSSGSGAGYRHWASGEPNDGASWTASEDCAVLYPATAGVPDFWNDDGCSNSFPVVCERAP